MAQLPACAAAASFPVVSAKRLSFRDGRVDMGCCSTMPASKSRGRRILACAPPGHSESLPDPPKSSWIQNYHPAEEIREPLPIEDGRYARLTDAETARTLIEVNIKGALLLTEDIGEVQQNVILPDISYLTDEHGDIYFQATDDDDILKNFVSDDADDALAQVIIGLDNVDILKEIEAPGSSVFNLGLGEVVSEDFDLDYDSEEDDLVIFEEEEEEEVDDDDDDDDVDITSEMSNDWSHAETMQATHPVYFAQKIAEAVSTSSLDWMDQPSASVIIQGLLRPAFVKEHKLTIRRPLISDSGSSGGQNLQKHVKVNAEGEMTNGENQHSETTFFKLEIINIQLVSACGNQSTVKVEDFHLARPDVIAHSAANILSRVKAGGDKTTQALKALCLRHKGIQVQEVFIIGLDSLGFDLRVCSGTQIQTLRFAFKARATSEFSAEKQIHDLLFPRFQQQQQEWQSAQTRDH
ncbi:uncharacterized protein At3g49140-like isoform X2 [Phalaenopsis equestris]|uniref:uncharacterized protein At3g49140-like isoform X2 n=1 Tax=Phalaenopsis equestris TaxID=78828 RepID=UPI0009E2BFBC|nr:uncharacterized protein At3g49140-like isoform X2 [Phalaenopsis equestris]